MEEYFLESSKHKKIEVRDVHITPGLIKEKLKLLNHVIFEVTENCNLRCKYCVFNGEYINQRPLSPKPMSYRTAKLALDRIYPYISKRDNRELYLGFYGGEPFLNVKLIKQIVDYAGSLFAGWEVKYNLTTNLTLLTDEILDYLIENKFRILVSLDGPGNNHDAKRVFPDGSGSFDIVCKNLRKIKEKNSDYFGEKVTFSTVFSPDLPLEKLYDFFSDDDLVNRNTMRLSSVNPYDTTYFEKYPYDKNELRGKNENIIKKMKGKKKEGKDLSKIESILLRNAVTNVEDRLNLRDFTSLYGTCLFQDRLYVAADGSFHICERVNSTLSFGSVRDGFDFEKMVHIVNDYLRVQKKHCSKCNIRFLCGRCYAPLCKDGEFAADTRFCDDTRRAVKASLEHYIEFKEEKLI